MSILILHMNTREHVFIHTIHMIALLGYVKLLQRSFLCGDFFLLKIWQIRYIDN